MSIMDVVAAAGKLKRIKRQGWLDAGIPGLQVESVADHCFRTALLVAILPDPELDVARALRMALVHDLGEAKAGDITPRSRVPRKRKAQLEEAAIRALDNGEILSLWREFEEGKSPEARAVREADVAERVITAREYIGLGHHVGRLAHFLEGWEDDVKGKELLSLVKGRIEGKGATTP